MRRARAIWALAGAALIALSATLHAAPVPAEGVTIAFVGDQGTDDNARAVLRLVADRGTDLLSLQGDFGYSRGSARRWIENLEEAFAPDFPVLGVVGNHENFEWAIYRRWLADRVKANDDLACEGDVGVKAVCAFRGITIAQVAPGVHEVGGVSPDDDYAGYLERELADDPNRWRVCSWHKNQRDMQVGGKSDEAGWGVYEACRRAGGIIATGHEHSYSRTYLMSDFRNHEVVNREGTLEIGPGQSFAFVSGLGGHDVREQTIGGDWWASTYSATQGASPGALFCTFVEATADCWFEDIAGVVPDRFSLVSRTAPDDASPASLESAPEQTGDRPVTSGTGGAFDPGALLIGSLCLLGRGRRSVRRAPSKHRGLGEGDAREVALGVPVTGPTGEASRQAGERSSRGELRGRAGIDHRTSSVDGSASADRGSIFAPFPRPDENRSRAGS